MCKRQKIAITVAILSMVCGQTGLVAPAIPNPQDDVRETVPNNNTSIKVENQIPATDFSGDSATFHLEKLILDTNIKFSDDSADLKEIIAKYTDKNVRLADLHSVVSEITVYFRGHGYPAATAYLPPQNIKNGIAHIGIEPGRFGNVTIDNQSHVKTSVIERLTKGLRQGEIIRGKELESSVYNIIGLGGVKAGAIMRPGSKQGVTDIVVKVEDGKRDGYVLYAENHGSKSSGRYRYGLTADWYEMAGIGDHLSANVGFDGVAIPCQVRRFFSVFDAIPFATMSERIS